MKQIAFNNTDLQVSALCLGTVNFGTARSLEESFAQMDLFADLGGNFLDTALVYADWATEITGMSEKVIGQWMSDRKKRNEVIISTKGCHPPLADMSISRVSREEIRSDLEKSLSNLRTDYIDLYFLHRDDPKIPVAEILETLEEEVKKGNLRYYGCSNWKLPRIKEAAAYAKEHGLRGFVCNQVMMALADVDAAIPARTDMVVIDEETFDWQRETGLNLMAFMCLTGGYFSKRLAGKTIHKGQQEMYGCPANDAIAARLAEFAKEGYGPEDFQLNYILNAPFPAVPIVSFSSEEQLRKSVAACEKQVPEEMLKELIGQKSAQRYNW